MTTALHATGGADSTFDPTRTHAHFSRARVNFHHAHSAWINISKDDKSPRHRFVFTSISFFDVVANITHCPFPRFFFSPISPPSRLSASSTSMARSCRNSPSAYARWSGMSDRKAYPAPNTSYEPKLSRTSSAAWTHRTRRGHLSDSHHDFQCQDDATVISTLTQNVCRYQEHPAAANRVLSTFGPPSF